MNTCMNCAHKNVCEWCIDDSDYDFPTCSDFLEERQPGEWITDERGYVCSECGALHSDDYPFCHMCGADMRKEGIKHDNRPR